ASKAVDQGSDVTGAEAVVDVHHRDIRSARIHHPQQRSQALKRGAVTDAGWDRDDRHAYQSTNNTGQSPFHSSTTDHHSRNGEQFAMREQAVNTRNTDVVDLLNFVAH